MSVAPHNSLQQILIERIDCLRDFVRHKIPLRFQALVSPDDVLQEIWIAAHPRVMELHTYDPPVIDRWLTTIAKHKLVDALRAARSTRRGGAVEFVANAERRMTSFSSLFTRLYAPNRTPSREVRAVEAAHTVGISLASLPDDRRRAIELRFVKGLSHREIARELNTSESAVNSLLFRGLRQLRVLLGEAARYIST